MARSAPLFYDARMTEVYRSAASVLVVRQLLPAGGPSAYEILLLHKPRKRDAWQLPQGGVEAGETIEQAALRELQEEAGIGSVRVLKKCETFYQYDFPQSFRRFRPDNVRGQKIEYVLSIADPGTIVQVDGNEIDKFVWVTPEKIPSYIKRKEYLTIIEGLLKETMCCLEQQKA
jgi:putative (di)nucleoside polyphosphate hydrolase